MGKRIKNTLRRLYDRRNRGITLVELVVIMAIISVMAGAGFGALGIMNGKAAQKTASVLVGAIEKSRVTARSQSRGGAKSADEADVFLSVEWRGSAKDSLACLQIKHKSNQDSAGNSYSFERAEEYEIGNANVSISAVYATGIDDKIGEEDMPVALKDAKNGFRIAFDRASGRLIPQNDETGTYLKRLLITQGNRTYVIKITPATGKCEWGAE